MTSPESRWLVILSEDGTTHIVRNSDTAHELTAACWCKPHWDTKVKGMLIHEYEN